jgi:hypothetical protein
LLNIEALYFFTFIEFRRTAFELAIEQVDTKLSITTRAMHSDFTTDNSDTPTSAFSLGVLEDAQRLLMFSGLPCALNGSAINKKVGHTVEFPPDRATDARRIPRQRIRFPPNCFPDRLAELATLHVPNSAYLHGLKIARMSSIILLSCCPYFSP